MPKQWAPLETSHQISWNFTDPLLVSDKNENIYIISSETLSRCQLESYTRDLELRYKHVLDTSFCEAQRASHSTVAMQIVGGKYLALAGGYFYGELSLRDLQSGNEIAHKTLSSGSYFLQIWGDSNVFALSMDEDTRIMTLALVDPVSFSSTEFFVGKSWPATVAADSRGNTILFLSHNGSRECDSALIELDAKTKSIRQRSLDICNLNSLWRASTEKMSLYDTALVYSGVGVNVPSLSPNLMPAENLGYWLIGKQFFSAFVHAHDQFFLVRVDRKTGELVKAASPTPDYWNVGPFLLSDEGVGAITNASWTMLRSNETEATSCELEGHSAAKFGTLLNERIVTVSQTASGIYELAAHAAPKISVAKHGWVVPNGNLQNSLEPLP